MSTMAVDSLAFSATYLKCSYNILLCNAKLSVFQMQIVYQFSSL